MTHSSQSQPRSPSRRYLLRYIAGGSLGAIAMVFSRPQPAAGQDLEELCSVFPQNSRCLDYLPGVQALDAVGDAIVVDTFLPTTTPGIPQPVQGLPSVTYLVIDEGPTLAPYGLRPVCPHRGCAVIWQADQNRFACPCHGSRFDSEGRLLRGPARKSLPLVTVVERQNQIRLVDRAPSVDPR
ncbi:Rieske 2Fe-2S domain-containing protein [Leptolyngbya sp. CCNP1308]|uniref:Rieske 2Fe-2S domain-containing protein n=1 Tax=Leptolyngbya sp. CCNP1308 TaxID=3110255 RepID=UPI002B20030B|nr:Rieske 2Fe-2S domain-containing protein [Leptolyngbya sp. CCNP1308]MEA5447290.1 Rieske 2Fe-2S domain-containing protein [Leptolyngbya sp. CCNP1308]